MNRSEFDAYLEKFNAGDYQGFLDYYATPFEMVHAGGRFTTREEVLKFYAFLHHYLKERVIVDRFVSDGRTVAIEARVRIEGVVDLTREILDASEYPGLLPLRAGEMVELSQFIHYHIAEGKFTKVECRL